MEVVFVFKKLDGSSIDVRYSPFDNEHSLIWYNCHKQFYLSGKKIIEHDRVYNFVNKSDSVEKAVSRCNILIDEINSFIHPTTIPHIPLDNIQQFANDLHVNFVHSDRDIPYTKNCSPKLWSELNAQLHGIEILFDNRQSNNPQGIVFVELHDNNYFPIPEQSYNHFTTFKNYGYAYASYAHVGKHLFEMFLSNDDNLERDQIVTMNRLSGSSCLWFGSTTGKQYGEQRLELLKQWFYKNQLDKVLNKQWGDPTLAVGDLPVGLINNNISKEDMNGVILLEDIFVV